MQSLAPVSNGYDFCCKDKVSNILAPANGIQWDTGAISNAEWTGIKLRDVLKDAGLPVEDLPDHAKHVQFFGSEGYGASIPIHKACDPRGDVLLVSDCRGSRLRVLSIT